MVAVLSQFQMTEISHVKGSDNVVADALSRYPEETGQNYDHLMTWTLFVFTFSTYHQG